MGAFISDPLKAKILTFDATLSFLRTGGIIAPRECNVCGYVGRFYPFGLHLRRDAACPRCHTLERHRLFKLYFDTNRPVFDGKSILHFAPESAVTSFVRPAARKYLTADLMDRTTDVKVDIENIDLLEKFDTVIASHVLEHVDDRKALESIRKVLNRGGTLLVMVPIAEGMKTFEDSSITSPKDRELFFGQFDHVRYYGSDLVDRLSDAGFKVERFTPTEPLISRHSLLRGETVFACHLV